MTEPIADLMRGIDHVGLAVPDLDAAVALHARLGWREVHREINTEQGVAEAMLVAGDATVGGAQLQLLAPLDATSTIARFLDKRGPGVQQIAYRVSDVAAATAALAAAGIRTVYQTPRTGTAGSKINFIPPSETQGVLIELVEVGAPVTNQ